MVEDVRKDYGERRFPALDLITGSLHVLVFTPRAERVHVISLRKASRRGNRLYEAQDHWSTQDRGESRMDEDHVRDSEADQRGPS